MQNLHRRSLGFSNGVGPGLSACMHPNSRSTSCCPTQLWIQDSLGGSAKTLMHEPKRTGPPRYVKQENEQIDAEIGKTYIYIYIYVCIYVYAYVICTLSRQGFKEGS